jgi:hypothetical protein
MLALATLVTFVLTTIFSMAGVGAAVVLIPVFLAFGIELHTAMATALLLNAIGMTVASVTFIRKRLVEWRLVIPMSIIAVLASPLGVWVAQGLDRGPLLWLFVAFLAWRHKEPRRCLAKPTLGNCIPVDQVAWELPSALHFPGSLLAALRTEPSRRRRAATPAGSHGEAHGRFNVPLHIAHFDHSRRVA